MVSTWIYKYFLCASHFIGLSAVCTHTLNSKYFALTKHFYIDPCILSIFDGIVPLNADLVWVTAWVCIYHQKWHFEWRWNSLYKFHIKQWSLHKIHAKKPRKGQSNERFWKINHWTIQDWWLSRVPHCQPGQFTQYNFQLESKQFINFIEIDVNFVHNKIYAFRESEKMASNPSKNK